MALNASPLRGSSNTSVTTNTSGYDETWYGTDPTNTDNALVNQWVPKIYSKKILTRFYENVIYSQITNTDYEGEIRNQGA